MGWFFGLHIALHWGLVILGIAGAVAALVYIPGRLGGIIAAICLAVSAGSFALDEGYRSAARLCKEAELRAELAQAKEDIKNLQLTAIMANAREQAAIRERQNDNDKVQDYAQKLAKANSDVDLSRADLEQLRGLVQELQSKSSAPAKPVRPASPSPIGCKMTVARYIAALNEANRRLVNDGLFYDDVRAKFGASK
jgi:hypothetical protein